MAQVTLEEMRRAHPDWIWPRGDAHIIIGVPGSMEALKTFVEPGNSFSPGVRTFGVSLWVYDHSEGKLYAAEEMPLESITWRFRDGWVPVLHSAWSAGAVEVECRLSAEGDAGASRVTNTFAVTLRNGYSADAEISAYLVLRSVGPAGGPVSSLGLADDWDTVEVNGCALVYAERRPDGWGCVSYAETGKDVSEYLRKGTLPESRSVTDISTWASGALEYRLRLRPGEQVELAWVFPVHAQHPLLQWVDPMDREVTALERERRCVDYWKQTLGTIDLQVPDTRFKEAFFAQLVHMWTATVDGDVRISNISYPLWWLRDGVYILNALDKGGFTEFAEHACERIAYRDAFGGFGAEADGPGQGIWAITEHYRLTRDLGWLDQMYPHLKRRAELIMQMRRAEAPIKLFSEFCTPDALLNPAIDVLCLAAEDGLVRGRMDWHFPLVWVNSWSLDGLRRVAQAAEALGHGADVRRYSDEFRQYSEALLRVLPKRFGENERDFCCILWPTQAVPPRHPTVTAAFQRWWKEHRCPNGQYRREPLWTYFEVAQAHNYLFLGDREKAWATIDSFLTHHAAPGLYAYHEGEGDENSSGLWQRIRGWNPVPKVMPHGWTSAELFLLLRDCMVYESRNFLIIGAGVPASWMTAGGEIGIDNAPTYYGRASWRAALSGNVLRVAIEAERPPDGGYVLCLPLTGGVDTLTVGTTVIPEVVERGGLLIPAQGQRTTVEVVLAEGRRRIRL
ncbi:MAG: hypothetical protein ACUVTZ_05805 [Armatimonadota bacterium]